MHRRQERAFYVQQIVEVAAKYPKTFINVCKKKKVRKALLAIEAGRHRDNAKAWLKAVAKHTNEFIDLFLDTIYGALGKDINLPEYDDDIRGIETGEDLDALANRLMAKDADVRNVGNVGNALEPVNDAAESGTASQDPPSPTSSGRLGAAFEEAVDEAEFKDWMAAFLAPDLPDIPSAATADSAAVKSPQAGNPEAHASEAASAASTCVPSSSSDAAAKTAKAAAPSSSVDAGAASPPSGAAPSAPTAPAASSCSYKIDEPKKAAAGADDDSNDNDEEEIESVHAAPSVKAASASKATAVPAFRCSTNALLPSAPAAAEPEAKALYALETMLAPAARRCVPGSMALASNTVVLRYKQRSKLIRGSRSYIKGTINHIATKMEAELKLGGSTAGNPLTQDSLYAAGNGFIGELIKNKHLEGKLDNATFDRPMVVATYSCSLGVAFSGKADNSQKFVFAVRDVPTAPASASAVSTVREGEGAAVSGAAGAAGAGPSAGKSAASPMPAGRQEGGVQQLPRIALEAMRQVWMARGGGGAIESFFGAHEARGLLVLWFESSGKTRCEQLDFSSG